MVVFVRDESPIFDYKYRGSHILPWKFKSWSQNLRIGEMASTNHLPLNTEIDDGGAWLMSKVETALQNGYLNTNKYQGPFNVSNPKEPGWDSFDIGTLDSDLALYAFGATAIARCSPNTPAFDAATAVGEIRADGLPSLIGSTLWKRKTLEAKNAGSEYLNVEFGWRPLVSELRTFADTVNESAAIWDAYKRGSGHKTRAGYSQDPEQFSQSYTGLMIPIPSDVPGFLQGGVTQYQKNSQWFKGAFKYYVPEPSDGFSEKMSYWKSKANKLYGVGLTPAAVWNVSPWTWAADWFANTGDLMTNISNFGTDGLVLQYGYAMQERRIDTHFYGSISGVAAGRMVTSKKCKRLPANPYGFGVTLSTLTARQIAIIAALGLSST